MSDAAPEDINGLCATARLTRQTVGFLWGTAAHKEFHAWLMVDDSTTNWL